MSPAPWLWSDCSPRVLRLRATTAQAGVTREATDRAFGDSNRCQAEGDGQVSGSGEPPVLGDSAGTAKHAGASTDRFRFLRGETEAGAVEAATGCPRGQADDPRR